MYERVGTLATFTPRLEMLERTLPTILSQVDHLLIYLNGNTPVLPFMLHDKINIKKDVDIADNGKFAFDPMMAKYRFVFDDDIMYPSDYSSRMIETLEKYNRKALITVHGKILKKPFKHFHRDRELFYMGNALAKDTPVHVGATCAMAWSNDEFKVSLADFPTTKMTDVWVALAAWRQKLPIIAVQREKDWLKPLPDPPNSIYLERKHSDLAETTALLTEPWPTL